MYLKENGILIHKIHILGVAQQELKVGRFVCKTAIVQLLFVGYCMLLDILMILGLTAG